MLICQERGSSQEIGSILQHVPGTQWSGKKKITSSNKSPVPIYMHSVKHIEQRITRYCPNFFVKAHNTNFLCLFVQFYCCNNKGLTRNVCHKITGKVKPYNATLLVQVTKCVDVSDYGIMFCAFGIDSFIFPSTSSTILKVMFGTLLCIFSF